MLRESCEDFEHSMIGNSSILAKPDKTHSLARTDPSTEKNLVAARDAVPVTIGVHDGVEPLASLDSPLSEFDIGVTRGE
jgi:hypothetical protein